MSRPSTASSVRPGTQDGLRSHHDSQGFSQSVEDSSYTGASGLTKALKGVLTQGQKLRDVFRSLDVTNSGMLSASDLVDSLLRKFNTKVDLAEAEEAVSLFDKNQDGKLIFGEFVQLLQAAGDNSLQLTTTNKPTAPTHEPDVLVLQEQPLSAIEEQQDAPVAAAVPVAATFADSELNEALMCKVIAKIFESGLKMRDVFKSMDKTNSGVLSASELQEGVSVRLKENLTSSDANAVVQRYSSHGDDKIRFNDFVRLVQDFEQLSLVQRSGQSSSVYETRPATASSSTPRPPTSDFKTADMSFEEVVRHLFSTGMKMRDVFKQLDKLNSGALDPETLKVGLSTRFRLPLAEAEAHRIVQAYSAQKDGYLRFVDFVRAVQDMEHSLQAQRDDAPSIEQTPAVTPVSTVQTPYAEPLPPSLSTQHMEFRLYDIVKKIFASGLKMREAFKSLDRTNAGAISAEDFRLGLASRLQIQISEHTARDVAAKYSTGGDGLIRFSDFVRMMQENENEPPPQARGPASPAKQAHKQVPQLPVEVQEEEEEEYVPVRQHQEVEQTQPQVDNRYETASEEQEMPQHMEQPVEDYHSQVEPTPVAAAPVSLDTIRDAMTQLVSSGQRVSNVFKAMDATRGGTLSAADLVHQLRQKYTITVDPAEMQHAVNQFSSQQDGLIRLGDFVKMVQTLAS
eukprot:GILJ01014431.1.p1 GENE.GILJ01014431.1~~GILJ01014431.1.p1  ORF type:complete len:681 (-),score=150.93 GILJ01014431.1:103-2145(-)